MRSLLNSLLDRGAGAERSAAAQSRPEALRRRIIGLNARLIVLASALLLPAGILMLMSGALLAFVLAVVGLGVGFATYVLHRRGHYERAAFGQVYGTLVVGLVLTLADPQIVDFGLAIALLAPIEASLLARPRQGGRIWALLAAVAAIGGVGAAGLVPWPDAVRSEYPLIAALTFLATATILALTAHRLNVAFTAHDRSQINAYRHLVENVQDAVMRFAADGSVLFTSKSAERLFGCQRYELTSRGLVERIHVLDRPAYMTAFSDANHAARARTVEVRMRRDEADRPARVPQFFWVEIGLTPVIDETLRQDRHEVVALLRDITDRHAHETEMREARRAAEDASEAKSRFLATIGHELRTPLNAIVGFSEMMSSGVVGDLNPAHREYLDIIHRSGHHLLDVVKMLLDMSRIEAGKFELQTEAFEPASLVEPCTRMVEAMAQGRRVEIVPDLPRLLPRLVADERAVRQIVINLLSNAIKFSHDGGVVTLAMKRQGNMLNISVTDRGIGMSTESISRIGEPFFQAQGGLDRRYEGTGLGLSIVKGLVELHEGTLRVLSSQGEGTTMTVLLPINGPETKRSETEAVTPLKREPVVTQTPQWQDEKRRAL